MTVAEPAGGHAAERGLSTPEVVARRAAGKTNTAPAGTSRSLGHIVAANVFTRFNAILGGLLVVILVVGPAQDALFGIVLVTNTFIGIVQELRAKRTLDRLAVLHSPAATVVRDGRGIAVPVTDVVLDDVVEVATGDQVVVDGLVLAADGLEVDESLLTGESTAMHKPAGAELLSGSFVVAGRGRFRATGVGETAYAARLAAEAQRFDLVRSELRAGIDRILRLVTWLLLPAAVLLVSSQLAAHSNLPEAMRSSVAGIGSMVPEGLVLLTTIAFSVGAVRLARRHVLVQELAAVEGLARVDVLCIDKTGTLTTGELEVAALESVDEGVDATAALGALAASAPSPNATLAAIASVAGAPGWQALDVVPFSSARRWSGADFGPDGAWVLGAPEVLVVEGEVAARAEQLAVAGNRVLLLARVPRVDIGVGPESVRPVALVALHERIRPEAAATLQYLADEGVAVKVLSGDHPATAASVAARAGLADADGIDARGLPDDPARLGAAIAAGTVFGRVDPHQKRAIIRALQSAGHVVAMTGDGVNDVLALKDADIGLAMGSGTAAARGVARLVLLDDSFAVVPAIVAEGRRVLANIERVANLFLTKTVYAFALAVAVGVARLPFPFLPRHLTVVSSLTIGIPAFLLALQPADRRARPGFVHRVLAFAVPAGLLAAAGTFGAYSLARTYGHAPLAQARTAASIALFGIASAILLVLARPLDRRKVGLATALVAAFVFINLFEPTRRFFALDRPDVLIVFATLGVVAVAHAALGAGWLAASTVSSAFQRRHQSG